MCITSTCKLVMIMLSHYYDSINIEKFVTFTFKMVALKYSGCLQCDQININLMIID